MRILLIEEEDFVLSLLVSKLKESFDCHVDSVRFCQKGIRLLKGEKPYDFIIADFDSSECIGYELMLFQYRHSIPGQFVFYTNNKLESHLLKPSSCVIQRFSFKNLQQFIINRALNT